MPLTEDFSDIALWRAAGGRRGFGRLSRLTLDVRFWYALSSSMRSLANPGPFSSSWVSPTVHDQRLLCGTIMVTSRNRYRVASTYHSHHHEELDYCEYNSRSRPVIAALSVFARIYRVWTHVLKSVAKLCQGVSLAIYRVCMGYNRASYRE